MFAKGKVMRIENDLGIQTKFVLAASPSLLWRSKTFGSKKKGPGPLRCPESVFGILKETNVTVTFSA